MKKKKLLSSDTKKNSAQDSQNAVYYPYKELWLFKTTYMSTITIYIVSNDATLIFTSSFLREPRSLTQ